MAGYADIGDTMPSDEALPLTASQRQQLAAYLGMAAATIQAAALVYDSDDSDLDATVLFIAAKEHVLAATNILEDAAEKALKDLSGQLPSGLMN